MTQFFEGGAGGGAEASGRAGVPPAAEGVFA